MVSWSRLAGGCEIGAAAQAVAFEFDAMGIVNDAVQYRIAESRIGNYVMPLGYRHLTCDQQRSFVVAIIDDLEQIATLIDGERFGSPVVEDEEIDALKRGDQARQAPFAARLSKIGEVAAWRSLAVVNRRKRRRLSRAVTSRSMSRPSQSACGISAASGLFRSSTSVSAMAARPSERKRSTVG